MTVPIYSGWITIEAFGEKHSYGLYPDVAGQVSDVQVDYNLTYAFKARRYYAIPYARYIAVKTMINFTGDFYDLFRYNCSSFASETTEIATGDLIDPIDPEYWYRPTPRKFAEEILKLEADSPTTEANPCRVAWPSSE